MRRWIGRCLGLLLLGTLCSGTPLAGQILVAHDPQNAAHASVLEALRTSLSDKADPIGSPQLAIWDVVRQPAPPDADTPPRLIVTIGSKAAAAVNRLTTPAPIFNVFLPKTAYEQLAAQSDRHHAAIYLDQPVIRQFAVARALLPASQSIGMLVGSAREQDAAELRAKAAQFDYDLNLVTMAPEDDPAERIEQVIDHSDLVVAFYDHQVFRPGTAKWLLFLAFQAGRPIIGFSQALLKAGAVAAVFSTPEQIGQHAGERIRHWLSGHGALGGPEPPRYFHIGVNGPVAEALGVPVPDIDDLQHRVQTAEGTGP